MVLRRLRQARYERGVMIDRVSKGGGAERAGLQGVVYNASNQPERAGDLIIAINDQAINDVEDYDRVVRDLQVGGQAKVKIIRGTAEMELIVSVGGV